MSCLFMTACAEKVVYVKQKIPASFLDCEKPFYLEIVTENDSAEAAIGNYDRHSACYEDVQSIIALEVEIIE